MSPVEEWTQVQLEEESVYDCNVADRMEWLCVELAEGST